MTLLDAVMQRWDEVLLWGGLAAVVMTTVMEGAQLFGFSRLSLPFLFGTFVTGNRRRAIVYGYLLYLAGAWIFAIIYALILESTGASWWMGLVIGLVHGIFLISVILPLMAEIHPRIATGYEGPSSRRRLEPPGPAGLNYGRATPASTVLAQALYGLIFAAGYALGGP